MHIHLIAHENVTKIPGTTDEWESGNWDVGKSTPGQLVGGTIYLHKKQDEPAYFGGEILSYHALTSGPASGRIVFRFRSDPACKGTRTRDCAGAWGQEQKLCRP